jgi:hypothetical protein
LSAPSLFEFGPDPDFIRFGDAAPARGFSVGLPHGSEIMGLDMSPQKYAYGTAAIYGGDPVVFSITMPRSIYERGLGDAAEMRFELGTGLEEIRQNWKSFEINITKLPNE